MNIKTYKIRCKVTVESSVRRQSLDITKYILNLSTSKDLYQPAGKFEIQLLPVKDANQFSLYYTLSSMDYVEIRFSRTAGGSQAKEPADIPIVMRGFVKNVNITAAVDNDGRPNRIYTITGQDLGYIFDITRIYFLREVSKDLQLIYLPGFKQIEAKFKTGPIKSDPQGMIRSFFKIAQDQLNFIRNTQPSVPEMKFLSSKTILGQACQFSITQDDGSVWEIMNFFNNSPWNELFTVDLSDGFYLVFRETPWKDYSAGNEYIIAPDPDIDDKTLGPSVKVEPHSILQFSLERSDDEVKNYFFTYPVQNHIGGPVTFKSYVLKGAKTEEDLKVNPYLINHDDKDAGSHRYGFRLFENVSEYFDIKDLISSSGLANRLNDTLRRAFQLNSAYESGSFSLKGNSNLRPGIYMKFDYRSTVSPEYYVTSVNHELSFVEGSERFTTTVNVQRGDGYLKTRDMRHNQDREIGKVLK